MNKIGLIFALKEELDEVIKYMKVINEFKIFDLTFYECTYEKKECILVECGIGKVNAARCSQILIDNLKIDYIINVGVAGGIDKDINICDVVIGDRLVQHDFDFTPFNYKKGFIPNVGDYFSCDDYLINEAKKIKLKVPTHIGTIASGDIFITDEKMSKKINKKFNALCVEMEGAAIAQTCYLSHIPFLVIRSISDSPNKNEENNITYEEFLEKSSKTAALLVKELLKDIK